MGVIIDGNLKRTEHIDTLKTKLQNALGVLYKIRHFLNEKALYLTFNFLLMSNVSYGLLCKEKAKKNV